MTTVRVLTCVDVRVGDDGAVVALAAHVQLPHVLLWLQQDDVHLWHEEAEQRHERAKVDGRAQRRDAHLQQESSATR